MTPIDADYMFEDHPNMFSLRIQGRRYAIHKSELSSLASQIEETMENVRQQEAQDRADTDKAWRALVSEQWIKKQAKNGATQKYST